MAKGAFFGRTKEDEPGVLGGGKDMAGDFAGVANRELRERRKNIGCWQHHCKIAPLGVKKFGGRNRT